MGDEDRIPLAPWQLHQEGGVPVVFADNASTQAGTFHLMTLPPDLLDGLVAGVETPTLKGQDDDDEVVVCSDSKTFSVRRVESSNTTLLVPTASIPPKKKEQGDPCAVAETSLFHYLEVVETWPRLDRLRTLLREKMYDAGDIDTEPVTPKGGYTLEELVGCVQASLVQILDALRRWNAFEMDGRWYVVAPKRLSEVLEYLLTVIVERDMDVTRLSEAQCIAAVDLYVPALVRHVLRMFGEEIAVQGSDRIWSLDATRICRFKALELLQLSESHRWPADEFRVAWDASTPDWITPCEEILKGVALKESFGGQGFYQLLSVDDLPLDPAARFARLFRVRSKWTRDDIMPYLQDISIPEMTAEQILLRFARRGKDVSLGCDVFSERV